MLTNTLKLIALFFLLFVLVKMGNAKDLEYKQWYACVSSDQKGEIFIFRSDQKHIVGDDINLTYSKQKRLYIGTNGFDEYVAIGLIPNKEEIVFGTSTIEAEVWKCEKLLGKIPKFEGMN